MPTLAEALAETWPAKLAQGIWGGVTAPRDAYQGKLDPLSEEGIQRATDLAGTVMGGTFATAPRGALGAGPVLKPIRAYHGSPYDFEKFDLSKIGTGEGAQAYGHGLYFAENPSVAQSYKLAGPAADEQFAVINGRLSQLAREMDKYPYKGVDPKGDILRVEYDQLLDQRNKIGRMYEVNIHAQPEQFLDWDKPIHQQSPLVTRGLEDVYPGMIEARTEAGKSPTIASAFPYGIKPQISEALDKGGIPGIKYLDQGSRANPFSVSYEPHPIQDKYHVYGPGNITHGTFPTREEARAFADAKGAEGQTSNYVLFRDDIIDIIKKYGLAGLGIAGLSGEQQAVTKALAQ